MSLMDEMKNVVTIGRELFTTVSGKMKEIDTKVDNAVLGVPDEIKRQMGRRFYLNQSTGNDSNDGKVASRPVKSFEKIASLTPAGASLEIILTSDYEFSVKERAPFDNCSLFIHSDYSGEKRKITFSSFIDDGGRYTCNNFYVQRNCFFNFNIVDIQFPSVPAGSGSYSQHSCLIGSNSGADVGTPLMIRLSSVNIDVPDSANNRFALTPGYGMVMLSATAVSAPADWVSAGRVLFAMPPESLRQYVRLMADSNALVTNASA